MAEINPTASINNSQSRTRENSATYLNSASWKLRTFTHVKNGLIAGGLILGITLITLALISHFGHLSLPFQHAMVNNINIGALTLGSASIALSVTAFIYRYFHHKNQQKKIENIDTPPQNDTLAREGKTNVRREKRKTNKEESPYSEVNVKGLSTPSRWPWSREKLLEYPTLRKQTQKLKNLY